MPVLPSTKLEDPRVPHGAPPSSKIFRKQPIFFFTEHINFEQPVCALFTVGIFGSFYNHFTFHFVSIFLKIETENEKKKMKKKWNPSLAFARMDPKNGHF